MQVGCWLHQFTSAVMWPAVEPLRFWVHIWLTLFSKMPVFGFLCCIESCNIFPHVWIPFKIFSCEVMINNDEPNEPVGQEHLPVQAKQSSLFVFQKHI